MAVIYVPQDNRWSDVGKGLGSLLSAYVGAQLSDKAQLSAAKILNDPTLDTPQKQLQAAAQDGPLTTAALQKQLSVAYERSKADLASSEISKNRAATALTSAEAATKESLLPGAVVAQQADTAAKATQAQLNQARATQEVPSQAAVNTARVPQIQAQTQNTQAEIPKTQAEAGSAEQFTQRGGGTSKAREAEASAQKNEQEAAQLKAQTDAAAALYKPADPNNPATSRHGYDDALDQAGITDPKDRARAVAALNDTGVKGFQSTINAISKENKTADRQDILPSNILKEQNDAASMVPTLKPFLQPSQTNTGFLAGIKADFAKRGLVTDPDLLVKLNAGEQAMAKFATSGSGFGGAYRVKLGSEVTPQVQHSAVHNVIATEQIATDTISRLEQTRATLAPVQKYRAQLPQLDAQIAQYRDIQKQAQSLWWGFDRQDGKGNGSGQVHYYYQGHEVDQNLKPIASDPTYGVVGGKSARGITYSADDIRDLARKTGLTPLAYAQLVGVPQPQPGQQ